MKRIDRVVRDDTIKLPLVSTIGRGPRGKGVYAETLTETDNTFKFVLKDWDTGQVVYTSPNLSSGELWVEHNSVYVNRGGSVVEYPLEITDGEPGGRLYTCSNILPRGFRNLYTVPVTDLNLYGKTLYPSRPDPREGDLVYFIMEDDDELRYLSMGCVMACENDEVVFFAETYCPFSPYSLAVEDVLDRWATSGKLIDIFAPYVDEVVLANLDEFVEQVAAYEAAYIEWTDRVEDWEEELDDYKQAVVEYAVDVREYNQNVAQLNQSFIDREADFAARVESSEWKMENAVNSAEAKLQRTVDEHAADLDARFSAAISDTTRVTKSGTVEVTVLSGYSYADERIAFDDDFDEIPFVNVQVDETSSSTYQAIVTDVDEERFYTRVSKSNGSADADTTVTVRWVAWIGSSYDEIADARTDVPGTTHECLKDRLDSDYSSLSDRIDAVNETIASDVYTVYSRDHSSAVWINASNKVEFDVLDGGGFVPHLKRLYTVGHPEIYAVPCSEGDVFKITGTSVSGDDADAVPGWMFTSSNYKYSSSMDEWYADVLLRSTDVAETFYEDKVEAPADAAWFIAQFDPDEPFEDVEGLKNFATVGNLNTEIRKIRAITVREKMIPEEEKSSSHQFFYMHDSSKPKPYFKVTGNSIADCRPKLHLDYDYSNIACFCVDVVEGGVVILTGTGLAEIKAPMWAFLSASMTKSSGGYWKSPVISKSTSGVAITYDEYALTVPQGARWLVVNFDSTQPYTQPILQDPIAYRSELNSNSLYSSDTIEANIENDALHAYWTNVQYDRSDYTYTEMPGYVKGDRPDQPAPVTITYPQFGFGTTPTLVVKEGGEAIIDQEVDDSGRLTVYNLKPGAYDVILSPEDEEFDPIEKRLLVSGTRRQIYCENVANIRDLGGLKTEDASRLRYGRIFRGGRPDKIDKSYDPPTIIPLATPEDIEMLTSSPVNLSAQIDIRVPYPYEATYESIFGFDEDNYRNLMCPYLTNYDFTTGSSYIRDFFTFLIDRLRAGKNVYYHCQHGADRTGYMSFLIEAACGVLENEMCKDYEITTFIYGERLRNDTEQYNYAGMIHDFKALPGEKISDKAHYFLVGKCGLAEEDFQYLREVMIY